MLSLSSVTTHTPYLLCNTERATSHFAIGNVATHSHQSLMKTSQGYHKSCLTCIVFNKASFVSVRSVRLNKSSLSTKTYFYPIFLNHFYILKCCTISQRDMRACTQPSDFIFYSTGLPLRDRHYSIGFRVSLTHLMGHATITPLANVKICGSWQNL